MQGRAAARGTLGAAVMAVLFALALAPSLASAQTIPRLEGYVTDLTGDRVLSSGRANAAGTIDRLARDTGVELFALYVDRLDGVNVGDYARSVASANSLGTNDALLVVAVVDRAYWLDTDRVSGIDAGEGERIRTRSLEPRLRANDWAGAIVATADALRSSVGGGGSAPAVPGLPAAPSLDLGPILAVGAIALGAYWVWTSLSRSRAARASAEERDRRTGELAREANKALIAADDAQSEAQQELQFAEAQFDPPEIAPYRKALADAAAEVKAAFAVRQRLDDETPEDPPTREALLREILERAKRATALLDEQRARVERLRDLERRAPEIVAALPAQLDDAAARAGAAEATLASFSRYADSAWASVKGHVVEARKRIDFARKELAAADASDRSRLARSARLAQGAHAEAAQLLDAVATLDASLREAEAALPAELAAARADVDAAAGALEAEHPRELSLRLAEAQHALAEAERLARARPSDPLAALRGATEANAKADEVMAGVRSAEERRAREAEVVASALRQAHASYTRAADYIAARRAGVGRPARTRLAEAESHYERARALAANDPHAALAEAKRATDLAEEAYESAREDFDDYDSRGPRGRRGGGFFPPIIIGGGGWGGWGGGRSGGGWGGGGFGGTPWGGGSSGGGGFGGSSGGGRF